MLLVDTDLLIDLSRGHPPALAWASSLPWSEITLPGYVLLELLEGCRKGHQIVWPRRSDYERVIADLAVGRVAFKIGLFDTLIGETAVGLGLPLHTFNVKHFSVIHGLCTIQPYQR